MVSCDICITWSVQLRRKCICIEVNAWCLLCADITSLWPWYSYGCICLLHLCEPYHIIISFHIIVSMKLVSWETIFYQLCWFLQKIPTFCQCTELDSTYLQILLMTVFFCRMGQSGLVSGGFGSTSLSDGVFPIAFQNHLVDWWASIVVGRLLSNLQAVPVCFFSR